MVSQQSHAETGSRARLIAAAAAEFAARGFDGAKVDRIARRARVNKAMLYYHFRNKAALYRAILADLFGSVAAAVARARQPGAPADRQLGAFIAAVAGEIAARPYIPAIWLREMAEGGRHLDAAIGRSIGAIVAHLGEILREGQARGAFREAHPLITQMVIVAPVLLFAASAPVRERFRHLVPDALAGTPADALLAYVERATLAALAPDPVAGRVTAARPAPDTPDAESRRVASPPVTGRGARTAVSSRRNRP